MKRVIMQPKSCGPNCICQFCVPGSALACYYCDQLNLVRMTADGARTMRVTVDAATGVATLED